MQRKGQWSRGMIPASGAGGREFDSLLTPRFGLLADLTLLDAADSLSEWLRRQI